MMSIRNRYIVFLLLVSTICFSQNYSSTNKKAIACYEQALNNVSSNKPGDAIELLNKALDKDSRFIEAYFVLAEAYSDIEDFKRSSEAYKSAFAISPNFFKSGYLAAAKVEIHNYNYETALVYLEKFLSYKNMDDKNVIEAKRLLENAKFGIESVKHPLPFNPINLGDSINSINDEYWPSISADENRFVITVRIPDKNSITLSGAQEDFYESIKKDGVWGKVKNMGSPLNTNDNEGAQSLSADGSLMFFTACNRPDGQGQCDIYYSRKWGDNWGRAINMGAVVNSRSKEKQPSISADGKTLYFASDRPGGKGGMDIWMTKQDKNGYWEHPINLGENINTIYDEQSPFIHPDGKTLYFSSDGLPGMGGHDLFMARLDSGIWGTPKNLGYAINTYNDEIGLIVNTSGDKAYFSSSRLGNNNIKENMDIYEFDLDPSIRPDPVTYLKGRVLDAEYKYSLEANLELLELKTEEVINQLTSDPDSGTFFLCLPAKHNYALNVSKKGYLFYSENFSLKETNSFDKPYLMNIYLEKIIIGAKVILKNIFFEHDSYVLKDESITELNKLIDFLSKNTTLKIEIGGHTDNTGSDEYNQILSENRAQAVVDFLLKHGINSSRLTFKGYGETQFIDTNETPEGRAKNRRTEFKIIAK